MSVYFLEIVEHDVVDLSGAYEQFIKVLVVSPVMARQVVLPFPRVGIGDVAAVV